MMDKKRRGIHYKLIKVMAIQLLLISIVTLLSVYGAAKVVENVLIKEALDGEAEYFWTNYEKNKNFSIPNTLNLTGYIVDFNSKKGLPDGIRDVSSEYQRANIADGQPIVHVSSKYGKRLYLVFQEGQVEKLAFYFGVAPLAFVLLIIYLPAWVSYMMSKRAISPVVKLSKKMDKMVVDERADLTFDFSDIEDDADSEVMTLLQAFNKYSERVDDYVEREKNFTRYASHELRTPLAVLKGSIALMGKQNLSEKQVNILSRMHPMVKEMEELLEALLLLSRDKDPAISDEPIIINHLVEKQLQAIEKIYKDKKLKVSFVSGSPLEVNIPERLFAICINNILGNAFNYTDKGSIMISFHERTINISDTGPGMNEADLQRVFEPFYRANREQGVVKGFGLGMSIVKRICDQMNWQLTINSEQSKGTTVSITL